jgi:small-conductance mechanosensitive channel
MYKVVQIWPALIVCKQVTVCPGRIWITLYFYISTFRSMCAVPNMAVFCSSLTSWIPGTLLRYFLNDFDMVPVAHITTTTTTTIMIIIIIIIIISVLYGFNLFAWTNDVGTSTR